MGKDGGLILDVHPMTQERKGYSEPNDHRDPPNMVVFLTDDHAQWALGCYGNAELQTPNIDFLAAEGMVFENACTPSPVCSPARASFFTGLLPSSHGVHDWLDERVGHPGLHARTIGEVLQGCGYTCAMVGKWHCGEDRAPRPGYDQWYAYQDSQYPHRGSIRFSDNGTPVECFGHQSHMLTDAALDFLRNRDHSKPFFLVVGLVNTHYPWQDMPERWVRRYRNCSFKDIKVEPLNTTRHPDARITMPEAVAEQRELNAQYYAAVSTIDDQVGRILDELDLQGILDTTAFVYTADHGHINGKHGLLTKGNATVPQNFMEESIRIPMVVRWPGRVMAGLRSDAFVDLCDLHHTLLDMGAAGGDRLEEAAGQSLCPLFSLMEVDAWRDTQIIEYGNARMLRYGAYKLIIRYPGPNGHFPNELYNMDDDPDELTNLYDTVDPALLDMLTRKLEGLFEGHATSGYDGREIASQPPSNSVEPWRT